MPLYSLTIESGIVPKTKRYERSFLVKNEEEAYETVQPNDFAYNPMNLRFGALARHIEPKAVKVSKYYNIFSVNPKADIVFADYLLTKSSSIRFYDSIAMGSLVEKKRVHFSDFLKSEFLLPPIAEQEKIASFLGAIDTRLTQLRRKHELLQTYKRGVMQKLFSQQIRFKCDRGKPFPEWEKKKFSQVFERITRKNKENNLNTLTISAQHGLINQRDFFNKSVSADDLTGYYLLKRGDFAYNKSYSNGYPMGATKRLKLYEKGVVSTLYICFSSENEVEAQFYEKYFEGGFLNHELSKIAQEDARNHGLLNMSVVEFFRDITLDYPSIKEQEKIANFLTAIDQKIDAISKQIELTERFKKGLLRKMFV